MTTRAYSQLPRLDFHQLDAQHYGLRVKQNSSNVRQSRESYLGAHEKSWIGSWACWEARQTARVAFCPVSVLPGWCDGRAAPARIGAFDLTSGHSLANNWNL